MTKKLKHPLLFHEKLIVSTCQEKKDLEKITKAMKEIA
jgi:hypothetical protein